MDVAMTIKQRLRDPSLFVERAYVGGEWIDAAGEATIDVVDPATGTSIGAVPALGAAETRQAIAAADAAWAGWRAQSAGERARLLMHALEFPQRDDHAQMRAGIGGWMPHRHQTF
jgi:succinate-semialdehyde dehydrogenase/glutarate-semialdehyde dehydrogenase